LPRADRRQEERFVFDIAPLEKIYFEGDRAPITADGSAGFIVKAPGSVWAEGLDAARKKDGAKEGTHQSLLFEIGRAVKDGLVTGWYGFTANGEEIPDRTVEGEFHKDNFARLMRTTPLVLALYKAFWGQERKAHSLVPDLTALKPAGPSDEALAAIAETATEA
jgi:hypothetical protein